MAGFWGLAQNTGGSNGSSGSGNASNTSSGDKMKFRLAVLLTALLAAGCGGKGVVKPTETAPGPATSASSNPKTPSSVDVHSPIADADYQAAVAELGSSEPDRHNIPSFLTVAQYKYNHSNFADALKIYQKVLLAT